MKDFIVEAVNKEWLSEIKYEVMGFTKTMLIEMLDHLNTRRETLQYLYTNEIKKNRDAPWDTALNVMTYFNYVEKSVNQLDWENIESNKIELLH